MASENPRQLALRLELAAPEQDAQINRILGGMGSTKKTKKTAPKRQPGTRKRARKAPAKGSDDEKSRKKKKVCSTAPCNLRDVLTRLNPGGGIKLRF